MHSSELTYVVEPTPAGWTVSFCHERNGHFSRRVDAIRSALDDADRVRHLGHRVTIEVQRPADARLAPAKPLPAKTLHIDDRRQKGPARPGRTKP